jgi:hypothetical protein
VRSGEEFHQAYRVAWGDRANFVHVSDLLIYRGENPPMFITDLGAWTFTVSTAVSDFTLRLVQVAPEL